MTRRILSLFVIVAAPFLLWTSRANAQTSNFTWQGGTNSGYVYNAQFTTIDGYTTDAAIGYAGNVQIVNGNSLWEVFLPNPGTCSIPRNPDGSCSGETFPTFPNNGKLSCESTITWSAKQWGTRADGSTMDGTKAGDYYTEVGNTGCTLWNGSVTITVIPFHEFIAHTSCGRFGCHTYLVDTIMNGSGSATVQGPVTSKLVYPCGVKQVPCPGTLAAQAITLGYRSDWAVK